MAQSQAVIIGSGFAGLAAACCLAQAGFSVTVLEKNDQLGGRARIWEQDGFRFDMGPSWYWMPDVFEDFFARFGKTPADYYDLIRLDPSYRVFFGAGDIVDVPAKMGDLENLFEQLEPGSVPKLRNFLKEAAYKYRVGMNDYVKRPSLSLGEFVDIRLVKEAFRLQMLQSTRSHISRYFSDPKLKQILEFPVLFLGGTAREIPAMYSLMNHADLVLGTWYPNGGMRKIVDGIVAMAEELGAQFRTETEACEIMLDGDKTTGVRVASGQTLPADVVIGAGDYHHIEQNLLPESARDYDEAYWNSRTLSPSSLLFYLGVNKKLNNLRHHNLFFDEGLDGHAREIYDTPKWPTRPLFYASCASQTDSTVAPEGSENLFLLMPIAPGLPDDEPTRQKYYEVMMTRLEALTNQEIRSAVVVNRSYAVRDFETDYHSYKGNAYGLANTLKQTAFWKPRLRSKKVKNLFYAGQLTVPGPGVPPSLLSGQIVADVIAKG